MNSVRDYMPYKWGIKSLKTKVNIIKAKKAEGTHQKFPQTTAIIVRDSNHDGKPLTKSMKRSIHYAATFT